MVGFGILHGTMTPEFGTALLVLNAIALAVVVGIACSTKIASGSSRVSRLLGTGLLIERFKLWRAAVKGR